MVHTGDEELDRLKGSAEVIRVYGRYVKLKRSGSNYQGCCPLHPDSSPSFAVYPDMRWTCFSGCGSGNIFQLVERLENCSFKEAVEIVKKETGQSDWAATKEKVERVFHPVTEPTKTYRTLNLTQWAKLEQALSESTKAKEYLLKERGITYETAKALRFGFSQSIGSLAGPEGADLSDKGWVALPYIYGDVVRMVKYRSIVRKRPGGIARQPGMETCLFNTNAVDVFEPVYLTSGEYDAAIIRQAGLCAVSLCSDSSKPTPEQKDLLMKASYVVLAGDTDGSGNGIMDRLWKELGERVYKLVWPDCKDANACFLDHCGGDQAKFVQLMDELTRKAKSQPMPDVFSIQNVLENGDDTVLSEHPDRLRFPWAAADKMVNVLPEDVLGVGATNTGMGKSTWVVQLTLHNARKYNKVVLNYQAEMRPSEIATMVAAQVLRKDRNFLTGDDKRKAAEEIEGTQYYVGCNPQLSDINDVLDLIEAAVRRLGADIVILDHFHHLTTGMNNETQVQSAAMTRIKKIAQTYKVIFINVGQPRKATQQTKGKQIHVTDFKGSGAWGDASNAVIALHRDLNKSDDPSTMKGVYEDKTLVKLLKGRSMGIGMSACYLTAFGEFASFEDVTSNYEEVPTCP